MQNNHGSRSCFIKFFSDMIFKTVNTNQAIITAHKEYQGPISSRNRDFAVVGCGPKHGSCKPFVHHYSCFYLLVIPIPRINELIAVADTPRRRSPASVNRRGSSHPSTHFSVTSRFNCSRTNKDNGYP
jgi:hypothetical protein